MNIKLNKLGLENFEEIKTLFSSVFTNEPWNDDWSDEKQLNEYIRDLMEVRTPVDYGLYADSTLVGLSIGSIKHWCNGTEYVIDELCIRQNMQGLGLGSKFLTLIEEDLKKQNIHTIFLQTDENLPAFNFYKKNGFLGHENHVSLWKTF